MKTTPTGRMSENHPDRVMLWHEANQGKIHGLSVTITVTGNKECQVILVQILSRVIPSSPSNSLAWRWACSQAGNNQDVRRMMAKGKHCILPFALDFRRDSVRI